MATLGLAVVVGLLPPFLDLSPFVGGLPTAAAGGVLRLLPSVLAGGTGFALPSMWTSGGVGGRWRHHLYAAAGVVRKKQCAELRVGVCKLDEFHCAHLGRLEKLKRIMSGDEERREYRQRRCRDKVSLELFGQVFEQVTARIPGRSDHGECDLPCPYGSGILRAVEN